MSDATPLPPPPTAVLLCGGKGTRLRPYTDTMPKPLVPLNGRPLLLHLMRYLAAWHVRRFVLCVGYRAKVIEGFVRELNEPAWEVVLVDSGEDATMTERLRQARPHVRGQALVCYGDTLANVDLLALRRDHAQAGVAMTLTVHPLRSPFGIVNVSQTCRVTGFAEKPRLPHWINIGFMLCEPEALDFLRPGADMPEFLDDLVRAGAVHAHRHEGKHLTVNTEKDRSQAETDIIDFFTLLGDYSS
jgi:glucose-1-phosphate cytidylyltransferase